MNENEHFRSCLFMAAGATFLSLFFGLSFVLFGLPWVGLIVGGCGVSLMPVFFVMAIGVK